MSFGQFAEVLTIARKVNNYEIDPATGLQVLWTDTTHFHVTVPAGVRWVLLGGTIYRNVSATVTVHLRDSSDAIVEILANEAASTGGTVFPAAAFQTGRARVLDPGEDVYMTFGVAQNAGSYASCVVLEIPYP